MNHLQMSRSRLGALLLPLLVACSNEGGTPPAEPAPTAAPSDVETAATTSPPATTPEAETQQNVVPNATPTGNVADGRPSGSSPEHAGGEHAGHNHDHSPAATAQAPSGQKTYKPPAFWEVDEAERNASKADKPTSDEPGERTAAVVLAEAAEVMRQIPRWEPDKEEVPEYTEEYEKEVYELSAKYVELTAEAYELDPQRPVVLMLLQRRWMTMCAELEDSVGAVAEMKGVLHKFVSDEIARIEALPDDLPTRAELAEAGLPKPLPNFQMAKAPDSVERLAELVEERDELAGAEFPFDVETTVSWDLHNETRYALCMAHLGRLKFASLSGEEYSESDLFEVENAVARFIRERPNDMRGASVWFELAGHYGMMGDEDRQRGTLAKILEQYSQKESTVRRANAKLRLIDTVGKPFPPFVFQDAIGGETVNTSDYGPKDGEPGEIVVIYYWASWSPHCAAQIQELSELSKDLADEGVRFVGVSLDEPQAQSGLADLKQFVGKHQIDWPQYYDGQKWGSDVVRSWGITQIPFALVVDREGNLCETNPRAELPAVLKAMIEG